MKTVTRYFQAPKGSFFLFGPRGTGKSTWLMRHFPDALFVDLLRPDVYRHYAGRPERLVELVEANAHISQVVVDEVQKIPEILEVVHGLIEQRKDLQFILTGSSARKIKRQGTDLMAGRALNKSIHPFMAGELGALFNLRDALEIGMVPLVVASPEPKESLKSYAALYVNEEVKMEGLVRNVGAFTRFLEAVSFSHGGVLNVASIARECQVKRGTVNGYLSILEDLLLSFTVPVFSKRAKRQLVTHSKFYLFDSGVFRSLRPSGPLDRATEIDGAALEGLVASHLKAWIEYGSEKIKLFYWRTSSGTEVDFIVYGDDGIWAVEVKNSLNVHSSDLRHLRTFKQDYPQCHCILLYRGDERVIVNEVLCIPVDQFLTSLAPGSELPQ
jgi:uncharacterized protein